MIRSSSRIRVVYIGILCLVLLSGCRTGSPWQQWMFEGPPPGKDYHPLYVDGWVHGCESGTSAAANHWYKFSYKFKQDPLKAQNRVYYKGWKDAFDYCQRHVYTWKNRQIF
jgi:hypothetical protein